MIFSIISWNTFIVSEASTNWERVYTFENIDYTYDGNSIFVRSSAFSYKYDDSETDSASGYIYFDVPLRLWEFNGQKTVTVPKPNIRIQFVGFTPKIIWNSSRGPYGKIISASLVSSTGQSAPVNIGKTWSDCYFDFSNISTSDLSINDCFVLRLGIFYSAMPSISETGLPMEVYGVMKCGFETEAIRIYCSDHLGSATSGDVDKVNNSIEEGNKIAEETKETTKSIFSSITEFFGSFFQNLIDSVIGLFVPSSDEMSGLFDQLNQFFSDRFGFLYAPFDYMVQLLGVFTSAEGSTGLTFPGFSIMGYDVWPDLTYDLASDELVGTILGYVRIGTGILLGGWFIMYLQDFFKERFSQ